MHVIRAKAVQFVRLLFHPTHSYAAIDRLGQVDGVPDKKALARLKEAKHKLDDLYERLRTERRAEQLEVLMPRPSAGFANVFPFASTTGFRKYAGAKIRLDMPNVARYTPGKEVAGFATGVSSVTGSLASCVAIRIGSPQGFHLYGL